MPLVLYLDVFLRAGESSLLVSTLNAETSFLEVFESVRKFWAISPTVVLL